jgi:hypothetical protein
MPIIINYKSKTIKTKEQIQMWNNAIKTALVILFVLGITFTTSYSESYSQKDSTNTKSKKHSKVMTMDKCNDMTKCKDMSQCKDSAKCTDMSKCKDKCAGMDKTMKMDSKKVDKVKAINLKAIDKNKDGKVYQCPMDFDVLSDKPGKDPKCGMDLVEVTLEQAKKNLTDHGFKVK